MTKALELAKFGRESPPAGTVVGDSDTQTLSSKTFSDGPVFSGLNANGVPFLNASKVLSSSSTFVFDGTNLGVGVASPAYRFDVQGSGTGIGVARFASNDTSTTTALAIFQRSGGAVSAAIKYNATNSPLTIDFGTTTSHALTFITADTERMRIDASGVIQKPGTNGGLRLMDGNTAGGVKIGSYTSNFLANGYLAFEGYSIEYGRFDSTGNFSIGTQSSDYKLTVARGNESTGQVGLANFRTEATGSATYNAGVQIFGTASATAANRLVSFVMDADGADAAGGNYFYITKTGGDGRVDLIQASNAPMGFAANYVGRGVIDMTLSAAGNLGLGTTPNTGAKFQVTGYTDFWNTTNTLLRVQHDGSRGKLQSYTGGGVGDIALNPDGGNVGIGTTNPGALLEIAAGGPQLIFNANTQGTNFKKVRLGASNNAAGDFVLSAINDDNSLKNYMLYITNGGAVGIGTTNPVSPLHVKTGGTVFTVPTQNAIGGGTGSRVHFIGTEPGLMLSSDMNLSNAVSSGTGTASLGLQIGYYGANDVRSQLYWAGTPLTFVYGSNPTASPQERMRILTNGNLAIGTTANTAQKLNVNGAIWLLGNDDANYSTVIAPRYDSSHPFTIQTRNNDSTLVNWLGIYSDGGGANNRIVLGQGGWNVNIGDTGNTSGYKLKVNGALGVTGAAVISSYATVGSIVANDPGAGYYSYNNRIGGSLAVVGTLYNAGNLYANRFTLNQGSSGPTNTAGSVAAGWYRFAKSADGGAGSYGGRGGCTFYMYTTGGWSGPGQTKIELFKDYSNNGNLTVDTKGSYYFTNWRIAMDNNHAYLEGWTNGFSFGGDNTFNTIVDSYGWDAGGWTLYSEPLAAGLSSPSYIIRASYINLNGRTLQRNINTNGSEPDDFVTVNGLSWQSAFDNPVMDLFTFPTPATIYPNLICEVEVYQTPWSNVSTGSIHTGYANYGNQGGIKNVTTMTMKNTMPSGAQGNVGTLSWSGNTLRYTSNRASNYDHYSLRYTVRQQEVHNIQYFI